MSLWDYLLKFQQDMKKLPRILDISLSNGMSFAVTQEWLEHILNLDDGTEAPLEGQHALLALLDPASTRIRQDPASQALIKAANEYLSERIQHHIFAALANVKAGIVGQQLELTDAEQQYIDALTSGKHVPKPPALSDRLSRLLSNCLAEQFSALEQLDIGHTSSLSSNPSLAAIARRSSLPPQQAGRRRSYSDPTNAGETAPNPITITGFCVYSSQPRKDGGKQQAHSHFVHSSVQDTSDSRDRVLEKGDARFPADPDTILGGGMWAFRYGGRPSGITAAEVLADKLAAGRPNPHGPKDAILSYFEHGERCKVVMDRMLYGKQDNTYLFLIEKIYEQPWFTEALNQFINSAPESSTKQQVAARGLQQKISQFCHLVEHVKALYDSEKHYEAALLAEEMINRHDDLVKAIEDLADSREQLKSFIKKTKNGKLLDKFFKITKFQTGGILKAYRSKCAFHSSLTLDNREISYSTLTFSRSMRDSESKLQMGCDDQSQTNVPEFFVETATTQGGGNAGDADLPGLNAAMEVIDLSIGLLHLEALDVDGFETLDLDGIGLPPELTPTYLSMADQPADQPTDQPTDQPADQPADQSADQSVMRVSQYRTTSAPPFDLQIIDSLDMCQGCSVAAHEFVESYGSLGNQRIAIISPAGYNRTDDPLHENTHKHPTLPPTAPSAKNLGFATKYVSLLIPSEYPRNIAGTQGYLDNLETYFNKLSKKIDDLKKTLSELTKDDTEYKDLEERIEDLVASKDQLQNFIEKINGALGRLEDMKGCRLPHDKTPHIPIELADDQELTNKLLQFIAKDNQDIADFFTAFNIWREEASRLSRAPVFMGSTACIIELDLALIDHNRKQTDYTSEEINALRERLQKAMETPATLQKELLARTMSSYTTMDASTRWFTGEELALLSQNEEFMSSLVQDSVLLQTTAIPELTSDRILATETGRKALARTLNSQLPAATTFFLQNGAHWQTVAIERNTAGAIEIYIFDDMPGAGDSNKRRILEKNLQELGQEMQRLSRHDTSTAPQISWIKPQVEAEQQTDSFSCGERALANLGLYLRTPRTDRETTAVSRAERLQETRNSSSANAATLRPTAHQHIRNIVATQPAARVYQKHVAHLEKASVKTKQDTKNK